MSRPLAFLLLFLLGIGTSGCEKEPITPREYPRLKTLPVVDISPQGATFRAEIIYRGDFSIQRYGFVWSTRENPQVDVDDQVAVAKNIQESSFSSTVTGTLQENVTYYVRAFVETPDYTVYGANVTFESEGSAGPRITRMVPLTGTVGDTVRLSGQNFSFVTAQNQISFNEVAAETVASTDTSLLVVVPPLTTTSANISLDILGRATTFEEPFQITTPGITSFAPATAGFGDTITMLGTNFSLVPAANEVRIGPAIAQVVHVTTTELQFLVPSDLAVAQNIMLILTCPEELWYPSWFGVIVDDTPVSITTDMATNSPDAIGYHKGKA